MYASVQKQNGGQTVIDNMRRKDNTTAYQPMR